MQSLPQVDKERIGIVGMSVGGGVVCGIAGIDERVRCTIALAPVADGSWWLRHLWENKAGKEGWQRFLFRLQADRLRRATSGISELVAMEEILAYGPDDAKAREEIIKSYPQFARKAYLSSADSLLAFKPINFVQLIAPRPIRFIHSADDTSVPLKHPLELYGRAGEIKDLQIIYGSPHCFWLSAEHSIKVQELTLEWLLQYL